MAQRYAELLDGHAAATAARRPAGPKASWHLYVVRHPKRDDLKKHLEANGVGCALHYPLPLHLQKCYASLGYKAGDFPGFRKGRARMSQPADLSGIDRRANPARGRR